MRKPAFSAGIHFYRRAEHIQTMRGKTVHGRNAHSNRVIMVCKMIGG